MYVCVCVFRDEYISGAAAAAAVVLFALVTVFGEKFCLGKLLARQAKQRRKLQLQFLVFSTTNTHKMIQMYVCVAAIAGGKHFRSGQRKIEAFPVCLQKIKMRKAKAKKNKLGNFCFASFTTLLPLVFVNVVVVVVVLLLCVAAAFREKF